MESLKTEADQKNEGCHNLDNPNEHAYFVDKSILD